jgi:hypothetical protein
MFQQSELMNWPEQLASLGFFYPEPEYYPENAQAASLGMEQTRPSYKKIMDRLRAEAANARRSNER